ncbi:hypothetical protein L0244_40190, partial [bacterium]|nr:hypothetical protein [bacterium]
LKRSMPRDVEQAQTRERWGIQEHIEKVKEERAVAPQPQTPLDGVSRMIEKKMTEPTSSQTSYPGGTDPYREPTE